MKVLVYCEQVGGEVSAHSREVAGMAAGLGEVRAVTCAARLPQQCVGSLVDAVGDADLVMLPDSVLGRELAAILAIRLGAGLVVDVVAIDAERRFTSSVLGGGWTTVSRVNGELAVACVRAGVAAANEVVPDELDIGEPGLEVVGSSPLPATSRPSLANASAVVVGGRGVGSAEGFSAVERLADLIGGAVGATGAVLAEGWADYGLKVGQTGVSVAPALYVGAGVSGATQHLAGMRQAGTVVAINTDVNAPLMELAHYAIVGDAVTVLNAIADEIEATR